MGGFLKYSKWKGDIDIAHNFRCAIRKPVPKRPPLAVKWEKPNQHMDGLTLILMAAVSVNWVLWLVPGGGIIRDGKGGVRALCRNERNDHKYNDIQMNIIRIIWRVYNEVHLLSMGGFLKYSKWKGDIDIVHNFRCPIRKPVPKRPLAVKWEKPNQHMDWLES
ncbi:uncharacterized protein Fot_52108 [Forsythia ovata]|uniref:Uncharacterized protein n=1 Tax=Forsythia ovata TaxID=205694 RepID=A0ABD1PK72_9LAMI